MTSTIEPFELRDVTLGRIKGEGIVKVSMRLTWHEDGTQTVDHETVEGYWRFSVSASVWLRSNSPDSHTAGQCRDIVARLNTEASRRLCLLWEAWHLNDFTAGCAHQTPVYTAQGQYDLAAVPPCPETGYRFGSAWLLRPIPDAVLVEMRDVAQLITAP